MSLNFYKNSVKVAVDIEKRGFFYIETIFTKPFIVKICKILSGCGNFSCRYLWICCLSKILLVVRIIGRRIK